MATLMFTGLTGWFSASVSSKKKLLWRNGGGDEVAVDQAEYVFSEDARHDDTARIYHSPAYLNEHLSVFHASYIPQCVKLGGVASVALGKYLLPPKDVQDIARKRITFEWELDGNQLESDGEKQNRVTENSQNGQVQSSSQTKEAPAVPTAVAGPSGVNMANQPRASGSGQTNTQDSSPSGKGSAKRANPTTGITRDKPKTHSSPVKSLPRSPRDLSRQVKDSTAGESASKRLRKSTELVSKVDSSGNVPVTTNKHCSDVIKERQSTPKQSRKSVAPGRKEGHNTSNTLDSNCKEEWLRLENLAQVSEKVTDFVVGANGCKVDRKGNH